MKNLLLIFSLIIFTGSTIFAQEYIYFGAKGGVNLSNMSSENFAENNFRTGFHLGILAEIPLSDRFSLQPEILYSLQGTKAEVQVYGGGPRPVEYQLDYIQVPVLAKIFLTESLSIEAGPSFNILVDETIDGEEAEFGSGFEFGGALGASYKFGGNFFGSARYMYGFTDAFDRENYDENINNSGFQIGAGFIF